MKVLIIIPAYNEADNIGGVVNRIKTVCPDYDYLVVNDGSSDGTEEILKDRDYSYVSLCTNLGIGGGVQTGYKYAEANDYDYAVQIDGDGQHNPEYIHLMIEYAEQNKLDMVIGSRHILNEGFQTTFMRKLGIIWLNFIIKVCCRIQVSDCTSGYRLTNKKLTSYFAHNYAKDFPEPEAIVTADLSGFSIGEIPVKMNERQSGTSSIRLFGSIYYMIKVTAALVIIRLGYRKNKISEI